MMDADSFVGTEIKTPAGGTLTVIAVSSRKREYTKLYQLRCSICSEDKELYPVLFETTKGCLTRGRIPCGCAKSHGWSERQYRIRIKRECLNRGDKDFLDFVGAWDGNKTKLKLKCLIDGNVWETTSIADFFKGRGCPSCKGEVTRLAKTKDDSVIVNSFLATGAYPSNTTFKRNLIKTDSRGRKVYWDVTCPICSDDLYVRAGVCSGLFTAAPSELKRGQRPCRCSPLYRRTQEQTEYDINRVCKLEGLTFNGWTDKGHTNVTSKFFWVCSKGHVCTTAVGSFLKGKHRCKICSNVKQRESGAFNGFFPDRTEEQDYLYFIQVGCVCLKVGRSFISTLPRRIKQIATTADVPVEDIQVLALYQGKHHKVYDYEQELIETVSDYGHNIGKGSGKGGDFSRETFTFCAMEMVFNELLNTEVNPLTKIYHRREDNKPR